MSLNSFTFNGKDSWEDFGVYIGGQGTYNAPQRVITKTSIPGRNGDLLHDEGRYMNATVTYPIVVMHEFREKTDELRAWLLSPTTYSVLRDTYHPDEFRMAVVSGGLDFETSAYNLTGKTQVIFDCKPQRFLISGNNWYTYTVTSGQGTTQTLTNPAPFASKPLIEIYGNGTVRINGARIIVSGVTTEYVRVDSETMNCYYSLTNLNSKVSLPGGFPELMAGNNNVVIDAGGEITKVRIQGRWWRL